MANYNKYDPELKEKVLRLYLEEGRTKKSLTENKRLRRELAEKEKEIEFLKKALAFFAREIE